MNVVEPVCPSASVTVIVTTDDPLPTTGPIVTVRLAPLPPNTIAEVGRNAVVAEVFESVRNPGNVSLSFTVIVIGPNDPLGCTVSGDAICVMVGASPVTVSLNVTRGLLMFPSPSVTLIVIVADPD